MPLGKSAEADSSCPPPSYGEPVEFRVAARLESLAVIRTLASALGALEDLDLDALADLRLALDEAATALIRSAVPDAALTVRVEPRPRDLLITVSTVCSTDDVLRPGTFSWHVISSLTDDVQILSDSGDDGQVFGITMTARRLDTGR